MASLQNVLWIGGPPGAGKTTVATRLARRHGLRWYGADTRTWVHRDRALRSGNAAAQRWEALSREERWVKSTASEMLEMSLHADRGPMVIDDLRALPESPLVVAEGSVLPADRVVDRSRAVWLIPTPAFQRGVLADQGTEPGPTALYALLRETIEREAQAHSLRTLTIDGSRDLAATVEEVEKLFRDAIAEGPRAETTAERRALLRDANTAIVAQVRGYYARPWAKGDPDSVVREFLCECGEPACEATVGLPIRQAALTPVLAHRG